MLFHGNTGSGHGIGDVAGADRTVQPTLIARLVRDGDGQGRDGCGPRLRGGERISGFLLQFGAALLELFNLLCGSHDGLALGYQEVATITRLDVDLVTQATQIGNLLEKDNFHVYINLKNVRNR